jgi:hypothetical protein
MTVEASALDPAFLHEILRRHRREAHSLLALAAQEWAAAGAPRFSDQETSCTAVLVGFLQDRLRARQSSGFQIAVFPETGGWSEEHLDGRADPNRMPRPDIAMFLGVHHDVRMTVECKRLLRPDASARDYILDGLARYLTGAYATTNGQATMICFALDRDASQAVSDINGVISELLGEREVMRYAPALGSFRDVYLSAHSRGSGEIQAVHLLLDLRDRPAPAPRAPAGTGP